MSIKVTVANSDDVTLLYLDGIKKADITERMNQERTKSLVVEFYSAKDLQLLQDELNKSFPENVTVEEKFKEPKEEGLYLTLTGLLLCKDTEGDWSTRAFYDGAAYTNPSDGNCLGENGEHYESDWLTIIKKLGVKAFPLTRVSVTPIYK